MGAKLVAFIVYFAQYYWIPFDIEQRICIAATYSKFYLKDFLI